jgi:hypothetical protein
VSFPAPRLVHAFDMVVRLDPIMEMGMGRAGKRRIIPIVGGTVEGERIRGEILNLGADWQSRYADGLAALDTRYALKTHDGAIIEIVNQGLRHGPAEVMARVTGIDVLNRASMAGAQPLRDLRARGLDALYSVAPVRKTLMRLGMGMT